jgi:hypothetical protein
MPCGWIGGCGASTYTIDFGVAALDERDHAV